MKFYTCVQEDYGSTYTRITYHYKNPLVQLIQAPGNDSGQRRVVAIPNGINHVVKTDVKLWHGSRNLLIELL